MLIKDVVKNQPFPHLFAFRHHSLRLYLVIKQILFSKRLNIASLGENMYSKEGKPVLKVKCCTLQNLLFNVIRILKRHSMKSKRE